MPDSTSSITCRAPRTLQVGIHVAFKTNSITFIIPVLAFQNGGAERFSNFLRATE